MPTSISITWNTLVLSILIIVLNYYQTKLFVLFCAARQNHYKIYPSQELIAIGNISEINEISYFKKIQVFHSFHNEMSIVNLSNRKPICTNICNITVLVCINGPCLSPEFACRYMLFSLLGIFQQIRKQIFSKLFLI